MTSFHGLSISDYKEICSQLNIEPETDFEATAILSRKLSKRKVQKTLKKLEQILAFKNVFIFGAGPSLPESIDKLTPLIQKYRDDIVILAIDGATNALLEKQQTVDIVVSDLDGGLETLQLAHKKGAILILHAHGDNIPKVNKISKLLKENNVIGSSQTISTKTAFNFGGFTDGDRGAYLAANFPAELILLIAFDFGKIVGRYSKPQEHLEDFPATDRKQIKFSIAKKLLKKLTTKTKIGIYTFENKISSIEEINELTIEQLENRLVR
jgi:uncharacterized Rossmann fold enzyme